MSVFLLSKQIKYSEPQISHIHVLSLSLSLFENQLTLNIFTIYLQDVSLFTKDFGCDLSVYLIFT